MSSSPTPRRASSADLRVLARMLARAFLDDPVAKWSCGPDALRPAMLERFHGARLGHLLVHEEVWSTPELSCAALWAPPQRWKTTARQDLELSRCLLHPRLAWRLPLVLSGLLGVSAGTLLTRRTGTWRCWVPIPRPRDRDSAPP